MSASSCTACGSALPAEALFCTGCGHPVAAASSRGQPGAPAGPGAPAAAAAPAHPLPICLGCGIVAPSARTTCPECGFATSASPCSVPRVQDDLVWVAVRASLQCRACGGQAPIDGFDVLGPYPCIHCGIDQHMDPKQWREAMRSAHDVADLAGEGAFPDFAPVHDGGYAAIGKSHVKAEINTSYSVFDSVPLHIDVSPGNPVCEACHVPLAIASTGDQLVVSCPRCAQTRTYARPAEAPEDLVGVVGDHHAAGAHEVAAERDPGGAVAIRCPGCSAPLPEGTIGAAVRCQYCDVLCRIGPRMRHAMGTQDATPPRWWALFRGPCHTRQRAKREGAKAAARAAREAAANAKREERQQRARDARDEAAAAKQRAVAKSRRIRAVYTGTLTTALCAGVGWVAYQHAHRRESPAISVSAPPTAGAPRSAAPAAPPFTVTWKGKVAAAKGVALRPGTACQAEMTAAGPVVRRLRVACGDESLYDSSAAMSGTSSHGAAIIEAPGEHGGHRYLLVYHDVGQRTGRPEIEFNSMDSATITGHGASPFEVTARFDAISSERTGPAVFPHGMVAAHQGFTAKVARVEGKAPVEAGQRCVLAFDGVGVKDDGDVCTVELTCGGKVVYNATSYCTVDRAGRPATYTDKQGDARFSLDVASRRGQMSGTPIGGTYSADLALAPAGS